MELGGVVTLKKLSPQLDPIYIGKLQSEKVRNWEEWRRAGFTLTICVYYVALAFPNTGTKGD